MERRHIYTKLGLVLLALFLAAALKPLWQKSWIYISGAVIPNSSTTHTYTNHNNLLVRVGGDRWVSWFAKGKATAYHALVIPPQVELREDGGESGGDGIAHRQTLRWLVRRGQGDNPQWAEAKSLTFVYHAMTQRVSVGSETYKLAKGNIFVVRLDDEWRPHVTQVEAVLDKDVETAAVVEFFKRVLPDDEAVKMLY